MPDHNAHNARRAHRRTNRRVDSWYRRYLKRGFDIMGALLALLLLSPVLLIVAVLVRWKLGAPVFFSQTRAGRNGKLFRLIKFRTMTDACDSQGRLLADEERLTSFGKFLRNSSMDELPECWNILRGEMSFVGPRPLLPEYLQHYTPEEARRHHVTPGLTGWAQINGRNTVSWSKRFQYDVWYVDHLSFALDLKILLLTFAKVLRRDGVSADGHATMPKFSRPAANETATNQG